MYEMLAIRRLFHRDSDFLTFKAITEEPIPDIRDRRPDLPPGMRSALLQAMARDPNGRFETAQAFGQAVRNSVATMGGVASNAELAKLLAGDFAEEMSQRDEILKAADDPSQVAANAAPSSQMGPHGTAPLRRPPPSPPPLPRAATSGEVDRPQQRPPMKTGKMDGIPAVMIAQESSKVEMPLPAAPIAMQVPSGVLDLSSSVPADTWMASPDTNLLRAGRMKSLRNAGIAAAAIVVAVILIIVLTRSGSASDDAGNVPPKPDAQVAAKPPVDAEIPIDAPKSYDEIVALSRYGFFSITANQKTTIWIDGKYVGDTPMTRLPYPPGPHKVKAIGPKNKKKEFDITIFAAKDTDEGTITW
jgi:serine/threonine-protein kinase